MQQESASLHLGDLEKREEVTAAARSLFEAGVMSPSGHANLSARVGEDRMVLTSGGFVRDLEAGSLALVRLSGEVEEGKLDPTNREIVEMHTKLYRLRRQAGGIIHTHSPNLLAFAMANRPLPSRYEALLRFGQAEEIPVAPWAPRGTEASVGAIVDLLAQRPTTNAVLLGNHGVLVVGESPRAAALLLIVLEEAAAAEIAAESLGGAKSLPAGALEEVRNAIARSVA